MDGAQGQPAATAAGPDARASPSHHKGDQILETGREEQEQGAGARGMPRENPPRGYRGYVVPVSEGELGGRS